MKKIILSFFITLLLHEAQAQVPGYMGLKCSLQYQGGINPQWNNLFESFLPYLSQNIQLGYVVSRKYEIGLQYTRIDYSSTFNKEIDIQSDNPYSVVMDHRGFIGNNLTAYIKFFRERKGFIAPLGRYYILGLGYENSRDMLHVTSDNNSTVGVPNNTIVQSHDLALTMGVGRNIILFDRMLITIEGDINIPLTAGFRGLRNRTNPDDINISSNLLSTANPYKQVNAVDVMLINLIQIKIGIGALLF